MSALSHVEAVPHVMTIAATLGEVPADLKTIAAWGCYGSSVITGVTAQNTQGVQGVHEIPTDFVMQQLESVWSDAMPRAVKLGMLTSKPTIEMLSGYLSGQMPQHQGGPFLVLDPVMISTSGHHLVPPEAVAAIRDELLPHVDWVTPNIPEALALARRESEVSSLEDMLTLAAELSESFEVQTTLLKGGHFSAKREEVLELQARKSITLPLSQGSSRTLEIAVEWEEWDDEGEGAEVLATYCASIDAPRSPDLVVDMLVRRKGDTIQLFVGRKIDTSSTHGTGCTLSSALACALAQTPAPIGSDSMERDTAVARKAINYVRSAISGAYPLGKGHGPLNHAVLTAPRPLPSPTPANPHPFMTHLIQSDLGLWKSYVKHPFVVQLGQGTLPRECFEHYIKQDYHYLRHYARAHALGAYKSSTFEDIEAFTDIAKHIARESTMHVGFCESFGIGLPEISATPEAAACAAYARYILDVGGQGDILDLYMAVASCLIGYGEVGLWLRKEVDAGRAKLEGNPYKRWIEDYSGPDFIGAVNRGIERRVAADPPSPERLARLTAIWQECVRLERDFWDMGLKRLW
ncbi:hypothetical protein EHS25_003863 [Saitozyma podzolica]|uniref:Pyridoxamine kinase/Phosphomethylpyrimidine kinase domain-containing protein n=1 Tax=Saitozyma podzolica TaxID=1890683 RepID=A0A427Y3S1_9TREE|nr:hypothetical protein EHS25_003863 [Saitozyma podzolica]